MKKAITLLTLTLCLNLSAQRNYTAVNGILDITAHGGIELERVERNWYAKTSLEYAPRIDGGFLSLGASVGYSVRLGMFDEFRAYTAPKIQFIRRGGFTYPSFGMEAGIDKVFDSGFIIGVRGSYDYRSDFEFWGGSNEFRPSGFFKVGFIL